MEKQACLDKLAACNVGFEVVVDSLQTEESKRVQVVEDHIKKFGDKENLVVGACSHSELRVHGADAVVWLAKGGLLVVLW